MLYDYPPWGNRANEVGGVEPMILSCTVGKREHDIQAEMWGNMKGPENVIIPTRTDRKSVV